MVNFYCFTASCNLVRMNIDLKAHLAFENIFERLVVTPSGLVLLKCR